ncbi:MAG: DUF3168 domain-containing protein [Rickettsiales bacterium]
MAGHTLNAVQKAIYQTLSADSTLGTLINGIFDAVPEGTAYPYIVFAGGNAENLESLGGHRERIRLTCEVYSRTHGRKQVQTILDRMQILLHHASPSLDVGFQLHQIECKNASTALLSDGLTWRGIVAVEAIVQ